jgi:hypothetical protein
MIFKNLFWLLHNFKNKLIACYGDISDRFTNNY